MQVPVGVLLALNSGTFRRQLKRRSRPEYSQEGIEETGGPPVPQTGEVRVFPGISIEQDMERMDYHFGKIFAEY